MKDEYINGIISGLCKYYGYGVITLDNKDGLLSDWAVIRNLDHYTKRVIVFAASDSYIDNLFMMSTLRASLNCENIELIKVILVESLNETGGLNNNILGDNEAVIDYRNNKIVSYGFKSEAFVQELANVMYQNQYGKAERRNKDGRPWLTYVIIAANVIMYLLTAFLSQNIFDSDTGVLVYLGAKYNPYIKAGEYYRLITCMFLHGGLIHLAFNMYALNSIGPLVEKVYGKVKYIVIYFISGITSSLFSFLFSAGISVGASGAIFGLLGAVLIFAIIMKESIGKGFLRNIASVVAINLFIGFTMSNIDNFGHLGGLLGGAILGILLYRKRRANY